MMTFDEAFNAVMSVKDPDPRRAAKIYMETRADKLVPTIEEGLSHPGTAAFVGMMDQTSLRDLSYAIALTFAHGVLVGMKMEEAKFDETK